jgi:hypothetical protein
LVSILSELLSWHVWAPFVACLSSFRGEHFAWALGLLFFCFLLSFFVSKK